MTTRIGSRIAPTIVFLHGGAINRQMWIPVMDLLADDFDCLAIDLPGHGAQMDVPFTMGAARQRLADALDEIGVEQAALVGLSLGGYVALDFTRESPEKVRGLVLSGATVTYTGWAGLSTWLYGWAFPMVARKAVKAFAEKLQSDLSKDQARQVLDVGLSMRGGGTALRKLPGTDYAAHIDSSVIPIVIANGERDTPNRSGEAQFLKRHPRTIVIVIEDAGHACAIQQPVAFARAVRVLMAEATDS